jgi:uncharacterized phiE125 gp8 family phage protein
MSAILLTAPAVEPVSLDEARAFLRVEHSDDDEVIAALTAGARIHVEAATRRGLIMQSWRLDRAGRLFRRTLDRESGAHLGGAEVSSYFAGSHRT